jgi:hypothetical protein
MSGPKGHEKIYYSGAALDLTFAVRTRCGVGANVKFAAPAQPAQ